MYYSLVLLLLLCFGNFLANAIECLGSSEGQCLGDINDPCEYDGAGCALRSSCSALTDDRECMLAAVCSENSTRTTTKCFWTNNACQCESGAGLVLTPGTYVSPTQVGPQYSFSMQDLSGNRLHTALKPYLFTNDGTPIANRQSGICGSGQPFIGGSGINYNAFKFSAPLPSSKIGIPIEFISGNTWNLPSMAVLQVFDFVSDTNFSAYRRLDSCWVSTSGGQYASKGATVVTVDNIDPSLDLLVVFAEWQNNKRKRSDFLEEQKEMGRNVPEDEQEVVEELAKRAETGFTWEYHVLFGELQEMRCGSYANQADCETQLEQPCVWDANSNKCLLRDNCGQLSGSASLCMQSNYCGSSDDENSPGKCGFSLENNQCTCDNSTQITTNDPSGNFQTPLSLSETLSFAIESSDRFNQVLLPQEVYEQDQPISDTFINNICPDASSYGLNLFSEMAVFEFPIDTSSVTFTAHYFWGNNYYANVVLAFYQMRDSDLGDGNFTVNKVHDCIFGLSSQNPFADQRFNTTEISGLDSTKPLLVVFSQFTQERKRNAWQKRQAIDWNALISFDYYPKPTGASPTAAPGATTAPNDFISLKFGYSYSGGNSNIQTSVQSALVSSAETSRKRQNTYSVAFSEKNATYTQVTMNANNYNLASYSALSDLSSDLQSSSSSVSQSLSDLGVTVDTDSIQFASDFTTLQTTDTTNNPTSANDLFSAAHNLHYSVSVICQCFISLTIYLLLQ